MKVRDQDPMDEQERRRKSGEHFRAAFQHSRDILYRINIQTGRYEYFSPSLKDITGYDPEEVSELGNMGFGILVHPDDFQELGQHLMRLTGIRGDENKTYTVEYRFRHRDGRYIWLSDNHTVLRDARGIPEYFIGNLRDVTGHRRMEQSLRESEARFRAMLDNGTDLITLLDEKGNILFESPTTGRLLGFTDDFVSTSGFEWIHPADRAGAIEAFQDILARPGGRGVREFRIRHSDGSWRLYESHAVNMLHDPHIRGVILNSHDITERKIAEEQLRESERRLRALSHELFNMQERERERLARELHDELGQKLTGMAMAFEGFAQRTGADPEFINGLKIILENANRELKNIYKGLRPVALDCLGLSVALEALAREFHESGPFAVRAGIARLNRDDVPPEAAIHVYRVLQEALTNAARHSGASAVEVKLERNKDSLKLTVRDNGRGFDFDAGSLDRGLGLFSMKERTAQLGGGLDIVSQPGKGVTLTAVFEIRNTGGKQETGSP